MAQTVQALGILRAAALAACVAGAAHAQVKPGSQQGLGLTGAHIPPLLQQIKADPYRAPAAPACESIPREIVALNAILGPDVEALKTRRGMGQMAAGYVRGMVPYRGVVRFLTRADSKDRDLRDAATAGYARRGFLRGLEANLQCAEPPHLKVAAAVGTVETVEAGAKDTATTAPVHLVVADARDAPPAQVDAGLIKVMLAPAARTESPDTGR